MTTAVEFLWNKLEEIRVDLITKSISNEESAKQRAEAFEQAKELETQQQGYSEEDLKQSYLDGCYLKLSNPYHVKEWFEQFKNK